MVRALQLAARCALIRVRAIERMVGPTVVPAGCRDFILWDSHVATSGSGSMNGKQDRVNFVLSSSVSGALGHIRQPVET